MEEKVHLQKLRPSDYHARQWGGHWLNQGVHQSEPHQQRAQCMASCSFDPQYSMLRWHKFPLLEYRKEDPGRYINHMPWNIVLKHDLLKIKTCSPAHCRRFQWGSMAYIGKAVGLEEGMSLSDIPQTLQSGIFLPCPAFAGNFWFLWTSSEISWNKPLVCSQYFWKVCAGKS